MSETRKHSWWNFWRWLPWRYVVRRVAQANGFIDPLNLLSRLNRFARPSEVAAPMELVRAGVVFHARGLMNTKAIQHNLDWAWPYWVERQFNPDDPSFVARAFSISHINLTQRNWTAVGLPDCHALPIIDAAGLVTPFYDGWSIDAWLLTDDGQWLLPARLQNHQQALTWDEQTLRVETTSASGGLELRRSTWAERAGDTVLCRTRLEAGGEQPGWLIVSVRPYNPEGVSVVSELERVKGAEWQVNGIGSVRFDREPVRCVFSDYHSGDVKLYLPHSEDAHAVYDDVGMATGAALFRLPDTRSVTVDVDLAGDTESKPLYRGDRAQHPAWPDAMAGLCSASVPNELWQRLYDIHLRALILHAPSETWPGPFTYKRFWFRDAAYMLHALLCMGAERRARRLLNTFSDRQTHGGYFLSQEGEWDANGEALWIMQRYLELTGESLPEDWRHAVEKGGKWIGNKRLGKDVEDLHAGLLPAGFSAEHLGNNDYYYWDDFWGVAGLHAAADMIERSDSERAREFRSEAADFMAAITHSLERSDERWQRGRPAMPASPHRRLDAGAVGSIVAGYPLQLWEPKDPRLLDTVAFLMERSFCRGGFFQDMIHSGINAYLTLQLAQVLLRGGDMRFAQLVQRIGELATATGQWPEAIHPQTLGGCMGDGQHIWASAEWLLLIRALFLREEGEGLVLGPGILPEWQAQNAAMHFGPTPTRFGTLRVDLEPDSEGWTLRWQAAWRRRPDPLTVALPGMSPQTVDPDAGELRLPASSPVGQS